MADQIVEGNGFVSFEEEVPRGPFAQPGPDGSIVFEQGGSAQNAAPKISSVSFDLKAIGVDPRAADLIKNKAAELDSISAKAEPEYSYEGRMLTPGVCTMVAKSLTDGELIVLFGHTDPHGRVEFTSMEGGSSERDFLEAAYVEFKERTIPVDGAKSATRSSVTGVLGGN